MNKYELMTIVDATSSDEEKESILKEATESITKAGGKVINTSPWLDKYKFTFQMKKSTHGTYFLVNLESPTSSVEKIKEGLRLNEKILRFLMVKSEKQV